MVQLREGKDDVRAEEGVDVGRQEPTAVLSVLRPVGVVAHPFVPRF